jgi:uncharacterized protein involved in type VI secretion and phage assembly
MKKLNGVYPAIAIDNIDPDNLGRVKVRLPQVGTHGQHDYEAWARIATLMAGKNRGSWFIPDINDEVLVAFEAGDVGRPYVIGSMWNGANSPPETMDADNSKKLLCSRNGVKVTLDDQSGQESFTVETPGGQKITLKDGPGTIEITDSNGNTVQFGTSGILVNASGKVTINASLVEINAGMVSVNAGMSRFSGVVQCDTLVSNSVISASYTPGAGNVL